MKCNIFRLEVLFVFFVPSARRAYVHTCASVILAARAICHEVCVPLTFLAWRRVKCHEVSPTRRFVQQNPE